MPEYVTIAYYAYFVVSGMCLAIVLCQGWRQNLSAAALGIALLGFFAAMSSPMNLPSRSIGWFIAAIASAGLGVAALRLFRWASWTKDFIPMARADILLREWTPKPNPAMFEGTRRADRLLLTFQAMCGAAVGALVAMPHATDAVIAVLKKPTGILEVVTLVVLSSGFLIPLHHALAPAHSESSRHAAPAAHQAPSATRRRPWYWYVIIPVWLFSIDLLVLTVHHAVELAMHGNHAGEGADLMVALTALLHSLLAGVATYYWCASCQAGAPSVMRRAGASATAFGTVLNYPLGVLICALLGAADVERGAKLVIAAPLAGAIVAVLIGFLAYGLYAVAGGWAIDRRGRLPVWIRAILAVLAVELVFSTLWFVVSLLYSNESAWSHFVDLCPGPMSVVGWGVALAIYPKRNEIFSRSSPPQLSL